MTAIEDILEKGRGYMTAAFPHTPEIDLPMMVIDRGDAWEVTFEVPPDELRGVPLAWLSKEDLELLRVLHEQ